MCLLSNAVKYSSEGTVTITTTLQKQQEPKIEEPVTSPRSIHSFRPPNRPKAETMMVNTSAYVRIEIADQGIGLTEEAMGKLFRPFHQAQQLTGGTGKNII